MEATKKQIKRWVTIIAGALLLLVTPLVGLLPGPGGVFVFILAVSLLSREIPWVRRWFRTARTWVEKKWRTFRNTHKVRRPRRLIALPPLPHHSPAPRPDDVGNGPT